MLTSSKIVLAIFFLPLLATTQTSTTGKTQRRSAPATSSPQSASPAIPRSSPTPPPLATNPAQASAPIFTGPKYSPTQLDFGAVDWNASSQRTFSLTVPLAGDVTLEFPVGSFVAAQLRRTPPLNFGKSQRALVPPMKPIPTSNNGQTELYKWNFAAGEELQLDVLFSPSSSKDKTPGTRSAAMKFAGPGSITPWRVTIPMRGIVNPLKLDLSPQAPMAKSQQSATQAAAGSKYNDALGPATANSRVSARPTPTPIPPLSVPPNMAFVDNTPQHSPDQFDFGEVWNGDSAKKTLYLTTNASGYVTIQIPEGPFRVGEFREMGAITGLKSKNNPKQQNSQVTAVQQIKSRIVYPDGKTGPFQWSMAPGAEMQVDIFFQPHFQFGAMMAGLKSQIMKITGPGPKGNWALSIPLRGMFDGLKITAPIVPDAKEIYAIRGDSKALLNLSIAGLGTPVQGTLKAGQQLPQGVSVVARSVSVPAGQSIKTSVELSLSQFSDDGLPRPLDLVFETAKGSSKAQLQFIGVSGYGFEVNSGDRGDCGVSRISLSLSITGPQPAQDGSRTVRIIWVNKGWNFDLVKRHYIWMVAESGGVHIFDRVLVLAEHKVDETWESSGTSYADATRSASLNVSAEQWAQILKGPFRFGCQESENVGNPKPENPKWGPAFKGSKL